jgi:peptide/nickel transport system permease protein
LRFLSYILRRLSYAVVVLVGLSILIFVIARIVPGDPARIALGAQAPQWVVEKLRAEMHLDKPIYVQYYFWLKGVLSGDFGTSLYTNRPVLQDIAEFLPATAELVLVAAIFMGLGGIILGVVAAKYSDSWLDNIIRVFSYLGVVTPSFVFAILLVLVFGYVWPVLPAIGRLSAGVRLPYKITQLLLVDSVLQGNARVFWDALRHVLLPAVSLALGALSQQARITRSSLTANATKDYVLSHWSYGIPARSIWLKFLLKPSLIPTVSVFGLDFAASFGNAFLVEMVFNWPGLSRYGLNVMLRKDLNAISAVIIVLGAIFVLANIVIDIVISFLDPRIRLGMAKGE